MEGNAFGIISKLHVGLGCRSAGEEQRLGTQGRDSRHPTKMRTQTDMPELSLHHGSSSAWIVFCSFLSPSMPLGFPSLGDQRQCYIEYPFVQEDKRGIHWCDSALSTGTLG